jgi:hypothetical protein
MRVPRMLTISKFVDANGSHNVETAGVFVEKCTSITGYLYVDECNASVDAIARDAEGQVLAYGEDTLELFVGWKRGVASEAGGTLDCYPRLPSASFSSPGAKTIVIHWITCPCEPPKRFRPVAR